MKFLLSLGKHVKNKKGVLLIALWVFVLQKAFSQQIIPPLEREVSLQINYQTVSEVLVEVSKLTGAKFSYSPKHIDVERKVSISVSKKPIRTILKIVFEEAVDIKSKGSFIIITPKQNIAAKKTIKEVVISGYVYDDSGEKVAYASILCTPFPVAAVSNKYGYYKLVLPANKIPEKFKVVKEKYFDTIVKLAPKQSQLDVILTRDKPYILNNTSVLPIALDSVYAKPTKIDTIIPNNTSERVIEKYFLTNEIKANIKNIADTILTRIQFSVVPQISTNKLLVGNAVNDLSVSLLIGYSKQQKYAGIAGLANVVNGNAKFGQAAGVINIVHDSFIGGQAAGVGNSVGKSVIGAQAAGVVNKVNGDLSGTQLAGVVNLVAGNVEGVQVAGIVNFNQAKTKGLQVAGIANYNNDSVDGVQLSGVFNTAKTNFKGTQIAGVFNSTIGVSNGLQIAGITNVSAVDFNGSQIAGINNVTLNGDVNAQVSGLFNYTNGNVFGSQVAGLINICSGEVKGVQVGSIVNVAKKLKGVQVGLINISEECNGLPIGLFSFSKNGYTKIELFADDASYTNIAFRTGVQKFHNIFIAGVDLTSNISGLWNLGYGVGSFHQIHNRWLIGAELQSQLFLLNKNFDSGIQLNGVNLQFEYLVAKKFSVAFGPTFRIAHYSNKSNIIADYISTYNVYNQTFSSGNSIRMWIGGKLSFKFF